MSTKRVPSRERPAARRPARILWTSRALSDLEAIGDYIARDDSAAAERWLLRIIRAVERAATAPMAGRRVPELGRDDLREVLLRRYRIVYCARKDRLEVLTVFEGHRRFPDDLTSE